MEYILSMQELAIVIAAPNQTPAVVNLEHLKYSDVIPMDWELAREPLYSPQAVQLIFQNTIAITAQPDRIIFSEAIGNKETHEISVAEIAHKYAQSLPNLHYEAVGFNPVGHASLGDAENSAQNYLSETLLASGPWQAVGETPAQVQVSFRYALEESQLNLTVSEAGLRNSDETITKVVLFSGNFNYSVMGGKPTERLRSVAQSLSRWQTDLETYQAIVKEKFLSQVQIPQPAMLAGLAS